MTKNYYLDGLRKLREILKGLLKKNQQQLQPVTLPRKDGFRHKLNRIIKRHYLVSTGAPFQGPFSFFKNSLNPGK
jgi:hypothetical protein